MIPVEEALEIVFGNCFQIDETEHIGIMKGLKRTLAEDVYSLEPVPPFRASVKDGYAVMSTDKVGVRVVRNAVAAGDAVSNDTLQRFWV